MVERNISRKMHWTSRADYVKSLVFTAKLSGLFPVGAPEGVVSPWIFEDLPKGLQIAVTAVDVKRQGVFDRMP
jgi:hypothetical protein